MSCISSYTSHLLVHTQRFFPSLVLVFNQRGCQRYVPVNFRVLTLSSVNLTTSVDNENPALTSHVNNIKICFLKIERMLIYTTYVADASEIYSVRSLQKVSLE